MDQRELVLNWFLNEGTEIPRQDVFTAIGYLAQWAIAGQNYPNVRITVQNDGEMLAVYTNPEDSTKRYVIGAVWHGDHYGFHS